MTRQTRPCCRAASTPGERIETLGAVFTEPLLIFARPRAGEDMPTHPARWSELRITSGGEGSGTRAATRVFLDAAGVADDANTLLPIVFLLLPFLRTLPGLYKWGIRSRMFRYYTRIREIDKEAAGTDNPQKLRALDSEPADLDREIGNLKLPLAHRGYAYDARLHIDLLRKRIAARAGKDTSGEAEASRA